MKVLKLETDIPHSALPYPEDLWDRLKYFSWKIITPCHNGVRDALLRLGIIHHEGRQDFLLGKLAEDRTLADFLRYIHAVGFGNHFIAWEDDGQVVSLRKLVNFEWQYHLRIFDDGEIRGHYEYTPESHPLWHLNHVGREERRAEFSRILSDWTAP
jgi:hypothetical protein